VPSLLSLLVAFAKALPALDALLLKANAALAEHRRSAANAQTDADLARVQAGPWRCPGTCPHRLLHDGTQQPAPPSGTP